MNWKIILQLSVLGFFMAIATISLIPMMVEPIFWLAIFIFSAIVITKTCASKFFLHGFLLSLINCVYIIFFHVAFYDSYMANHPEMAKMPILFASHPRESMVVTGIFAGIVCGLIVGLLAFIASKFFVKKPVTA
jgi:hypothetical protein